MQHLSAGEVLQIWEQGQGLHPLDRALGLLAVANPTTPWEQLARLPIGQRDALLLTLRQDMLGSRLAGYAECPACSERLELGIDSRQILAGQEWPKTPDAAAQSVEVDSFHISFRLLDSFDLAAIATSQDVAAARKTLIQRSVLDIRCNGEPVAALPSDMETRVSEALIQADPLADLQFDLSCPACGHLWQLAFDITAFFWAEINNLAKRLLYEIHTLAHAYGWREADILAMSPARRQTYLDLVIG
jgi:hypothetical protein